MQGSIETSDKVKHLSKTCLRLGMQKYESEETIGKIEELIDRIKKEKADKKLLKDRLLSL